MKLQLNRGWETSMKIVMKPYHVRFSDPGRKCKAKYGNFAI